MRCSVGTVNGVRTRGSLPLGFGVLGILCVVGASSAVAPLAARETAISALTFFGTDQQGWVNPAYRWNTVYPDAAWDIGLLEDAMPPDLPVLWLNNLDDYGVSVPLTPGQERTFGMCVSVVPEGYYGLNLFFGGKENPSPGSPGISVFAYTDVDGPGDPPVYEAIRSDITTMGWAIADVGGSGSLVYNDWEQGVCVTLVAFVIYTPEALGLDLVQPQEPGGQLRFLDATDGKADLLATFTLEVTECPMAPSDLVCSRSPDGANVTLQWTNYGPYDSLAIEREGTRIATLDPNATSYLDAGVSPMTHNYAVVAGLGGAELPRRCTAADPAHPDVILTAITIYGATDQGTVRYEERWNTTYLDAAWDIALHEGPLVTDAGEYDPTDPTFWLNKRSDMSVYVPLMAGQERTFSFYMARSALDANWFGVNLFFDGMQEPAGGTAGISAFAFTDVDGPGDPPAFAPDGAALTMGWPIADIPGAGTLEFTSVEDNLKATLTDFVIYTQAALNGGNGIDFVQQQDPGGRLSIDSSDWLGDFTGQFTLIVERVQLEPTFQRGDVNVDGQVNIADPVTLLGYLFAQKPASSCPDTADGNDDGALNIADAIRILGTLFGGVGPLPAPYTQCGSDPTIDALAPCVFDPKNCPP